MKDAFCAFAAHSLSTTKARHAATSVLHVSATLTADTLLKLRLLIILDDHSRKLVRAKLKIDIFLLLLNESERGYFLHALNADKNRLSRINGYARNSRIF